MRPRTPLAVDQSKFAIIPHPHTTLTHLHLVYQLCWFMHSR